MDSETKTKKEYRSKNKGVDWKVEIACGRRCPTCRRETDPEKDYIRSNNQNVRTKLCFKCRKTSRDSINKYSVKTVKRKKSIKLTMKDKINVYEKILHALPKDIIELIPEDILNEFNIDNPYDLIKRDDE